MLPRRRCTHCGLSLPATREYFYKRNDDKTTYQSQCIECQQDYARRKRENIISTREYRIEHMLDGVAISRAVADYQELLFDIKHRRARNVASI